MQKQKTEQELEQEFDRLYSEGKVGEGVLDDDLPDFRDNWVAERASEPSETHKTITDLLDELNASTEQLRVEAEELVELSKKFLNYPWLMK